MTAIIAFFSHEQEAQEFIRQSALETTIYSITYLNGTEPVGSYGWQPTSLADTLNQQGFHPEQCNNCVLALENGQVAVLLECEDAADILMALHSHGVRDYHMA